LLNAWSWEYERQVGAEMKAMSGAKPEPTPELNRTRKAYLECYAAITGRLKPRMECGDPAPLSPRAGGAP
jgi:hypothetical protein